MKKVVVIGGGISGLATAYYILKRAQEKGEEVELTLLEASSRTGGKIWSPSQEGYICEVGPNGFLDNKPWTLELCDDLDISERLMPSSENSRKRFVYVNGRLRELPPSATGFVFSDILSWKGKMRIALEIFTQPSEQEDETVASFVQRHLGEEALKKLVGPMVSGVYAGDPYRMSLKSAFPVMSQLEKEGGGSLIRAAMGRMKKAREEKKEEKRGFKKGSAAGPGGVLTSFPEGIEYLTNSLTQALGERVKLSSRATRIEEGDENFLVAYDSHEGPGALEADAVVTATPAYTTGELLSYLDSEMASRAGEIPYTKLALVCLGYERGEVEHDLQGFGFLVPHEENKTILGCLWDSSMFDHRAPEGKALLRVMVGGARAEEKALLDDEELLSAIKSDLEDTMGITAEPEFVRIFRHRKAIPQYNLGHGKVVKALEEKMEEHRGLFITGNAYRGVGINDCVHQSQITAERVTEYLYH